MEPLPSPPRWFAPGALVAIGCMTGASVLYALFSDPIADWSSMVESVVYIALVFLVINTLISARFGVVKLMLRSAQQSFAAGDTKLAARRVRSAAGIPYAYCVASSIYGVIFAALTGRLLLSLTFSAFALLMFAILHPHVLHSLARQRGQLTQEPGL